MTRKGLSQRPWTTEELAALRGMAGHIPKREICRALKRSSGAVRATSSRMGLSLRCYKSKLQWCNECATWRSSLDNNGSCKVCRMRERLDGREAACSEVLASMKPEQRQIYEDSEPKRGSRHISRPLRAKTYRGKSALNNYQKARVDTEHILAIEQCEYLRLKLRYDAAKTRLNRMRRALREDEKISK